LQAKLGKGLQEQKRGESWQPSIDDSVTDECNPDLAITASNHQLSNEEKPIDEGANLILQPFSNKGGQNHGTNSSTSILEFTSHFNVQPSQLKGKIVRNDSFVGKQQSSVTTNTIDQISHYKGVDYEFPSRYRPG